MARNSSGVMSLVAGNPVVTGTKITSTWANTTLSDIASEITNSLDRAGRGRMTVPILQPDGTALLPAFSFINDPDTGVYLSAVGTINIAVAGASVMNWTATRITGLQPFSAPNGTAGAPSYSFNTAGATGVNWDGTNLGLSVGGAVRMSVSTTAITKTVPTLAANGAVGAPSYAFSADATTGMWLSGGTAIAFSVAGVQTLLMSATLNTFAQRLAAPDGTVGNVAYGFSASTSMGMYRIGAGDLGFAASGTQVVSMTNARVAFALPLRAADGSDAAPSYSFTSDTNTGIHWIGADSMGLDAGGRTALKITPDRVTGHITNAYTTAGTSTAYTISPDPAITSYIAGLSYWVSFDEACGNNPTLQISGVATPPNLVKRQPDGSVANLVAGDVDLSETYRVTLIGPTQALVEDLGAPSMVLGPTTTLSAGSHDVTGIPSWVKRITINLSNASLTGTTNILVQIGDAGGIESTTYSSSSGSGANTTSWTTSSSTSGFLILAGTAANAYSGQIRLTLQNAGTFAWIAEGIFHGPAGTLIMTAGVKALSATLDRFRITQTGADTFDGGSFNYILEG